MGAEGSVLLTGGTGFVGRPLLLRLLEEDRAVTLLGRKAPDFVPTSGRRRLAFCACDLGQPETLEPHARRLAGVTEAILAGGFMLASSKREDDDRRLSLATHVAGTAAVLDLLGPSLRWIGYVSTIDVYGTPRRLPIDETHPTSPSTYYGLSKLAAEGLVRVFARDRRIPRATLRLSQVYGPGDTGRKAIPNLVSTALAGEPIVLTGSGAERRSYLYVDDGVEAVMAALARRAEGVFNVAGATAASVLEVAETLRRLCGLAEPVRCGNGGGPSLDIDISLARRELGFQPATSLEEGLRRTVAARSHA
ncbi:MAG: NAD-dependent epimerase/dehydratase family protein [Actinomycetota bacterium]